jgi:threonine dehydratase
LNTMAGAKLFFKCENFQKVGAFKMRGATNAVLSMSPTEQKKGFATHSSGNHGQAVALAAKITGNPAHIVMPKNAPKAKIAAVQSYAGNITFCDNTEDARKSTSAQVVAHTGAHFIHPFNNWEVIYGQATCAKEVYEELPDLDYMLCPVGGGGLASGTLLTTQAFSPKTKVILAEPENAADAHASFTQKKHIPVNNPQTIADGLKTSLGDITFPIILNGAEAIITVTEEEIIAAMRLIWERLKIICEPSCAPPLAAVLKTPNVFKNKTVGIIITGGNVDLSALPF